MNPQSYHQQSKEPHDLPALWRQCAARDSDWTPFVRRVDPVLRSTFVGLGRSYGVYLNRDLLDEVIQELYVRLLQNDRRVLRGCRGQSETTILSYLRRVARSTLIDWLRARRALKRGPAVELSLDALEPSGEHTEVFDVPNRTSSPFDSCYTQELRQRFRHECRNVAGPGRKARRDAWIAERMVVDGWNSHEAAQAVHLAPATVATVLTRMRRSLRRRGLLMPERISSRA